ncbi:MAG TPA: arsenosugar biosynthesis radical SAM (seleno)protein ArsS [Vicinamibacterales bacterium]|nr:arsenosugar biosynthesis radical SAM (seleno)protein ArsS [Vicinamibacterales bacterium]
MALLTLLNSRSPLASPEAQRARLEAVALPVSFDHAIARAGAPALRTVEPVVLQINVGKRCNQACHHCHVDAGPDRTEVMTDDVVEAVLGVLEQSAIPTVDITGGAPELHPRFREIVTRAHALGRHVMDRCNLTITTLPNYADLPEFLAAHGVEVVASLPSYAASQTDRQRGDGVFEKSIEALRRFNAHGYGREGSGLLLNLVTNPVGAFLPAAQAALERDWKRELKRRHGIDFNRLFTITNMPISRYLEWLEQSGHLEGYLTKLVNAFNPATVDGLMCRFTLSVGWDGRLYDCDFNQMLDLALPQTIFDGLPPERAIMTGPHCFGCTAGAGSSCGGTTV